MSSGYLLLPSTKSGRKGRFWFPADRTGQADHFRDLGRDSDTRASSHLVISAYHTAIETPHLTSPVSTYHSALAWCPLHAAAMPPSHQSFQMAQQSPQQQSNSQPSSYGAHHSYNHSFDGSQQQSHSQPAPASYAQSFPNGPVSNPGYARSFGDGAMSNMRQYNEKPQIYTVCPYLMRSVQ